MSTNVILYHRVAELNSVEIFRHKLGKGMGMECRFILVGLNEQESKVKNAYWLRQRCERSVSLCIPCNFIDDHY